MLKGIENKVAQRIMKISDNQKINILNLAVLSNHVHAIIQLKSVQSLSDVVQILKGASSLWINQQKLRPYKFRWEDGYFAFSLGYSQLVHFKTYLTSQTELHGRISLKEELSQISTKYQITE
jgi:putative transposase